MTWRDHLPKPCGPLLKDVKLAPYSWFRVGGMADVLYLPSDEADLQQFLTQIDPKIPITVMGVGSNLLIRDGGVEGIVIRLGKGFSNLGPAEDGQICAGVGVLDSKLAYYAAESGLSGLEFFAGIPGTVGGALAMNSGCYGQETQNMFVSATALTRRGLRKTLMPQDMGFSYRHTRAAFEDGLIFTQARFHGQADAPAAIFERIAAITEKRQNSQPIREKTGGSSFKNPPGFSAWKLIDQAGWRGAVLGDAMISELHANFLINRGKATAQDLEGLGEAIRKDVKARFDIDLDWEIRIIGRKALA